MNLEVRILIGIAKIMGVMKNNEPNAIHYATRIKGIFLRIRKKIEDYRSSYNVLIMFL